MTIKIRDLSLVPNVLNLAGKYGANQVNGLNFTIDDAEILKSQARKKALEDAKNKALMIARSLGVKLVAVTSYSEYESSDYPMPMFDNMAKNVMAPATASAGTPDGISGGTKDVSLNVSVTYQIAQ